jgi:hypothetical protein
MDENGFLTPKHTIPVFRRRKLITVALPTGMHCLKGGNLVGLVFSSLLVLPRLRTHERVLF